MSLRKLYTIAFMSDQSRHTGGVAPAAGIARKGRGGARRPRRAVVLSWAAVAAWAVFIFCMSANTGSNLEHGGGIVSQVFQWLKALQGQVLGPDVDAVNPAAHFCEYAVFGALLANAWRRLGGRTGAAAPWLAVVPAVVCASLYGVTDELHQYFVPGRACDPVDWLVDTSGATLGAVLFAVIASRAKARE